MAEDNIIKTFDLQKYDLSIVIPVFNSEQLVLNTVLEIQKELSIYRFEIILINDGSSDNSWNVIKNIAIGSKNITSINLLKNYGQHTAVFCGLKHASGKYIVTMDDDLQNPPSEIHKLFNRIEEGYDLVFGKFPLKKHSFYRRIGSKIINYLNGVIFNKPKDITLSNFRIFTKSVSDRALSYKTNYPYIPGLLLLHSSEIGNVLTLHEERKIGKSNYTTK